jgi:hypothetical protein
VRAGHKLASDVGDDRAKVETMTRTATKVDKTSENVAHFELRCTVMPDSTMRITI